jgi:hypothetical protein
MRVGFANSIALQIGADRDGDRLCARFFQMSGAIDTARQLNADIAQLSRPVENEAVG